MKKSTFYKLLKINRLVKNHRLKFLALFLAQIFKLRYLSIRFDPVIACNLRCQMCHFSDRKWRENHKGVMSSEDVKRLEEVFLKISYQFYIGCGAEPTLYKNFTDLVKMAKLNNVPFIGFVSNGQLLEEKHIRQFVEYGLNELTLSTHGVKMETYERLMENASYDKFKDLLATIDRVKEETGSSLPSIRINYTVNPDNLDELGEFFKEFGQYHIDVLQIRPIIDLGNTVYKNKNFRPYLEKYNHVIDKLHDICKEKDILFMANKVDPTYSQDNYAGIIMNYIKVDVSPQHIVPSDFDWRNESYEAYCKRTSLRKIIFKNIFRNIKDIASLSTSLSYDID